MFIFSNKVLGKIWLIELFFPISQRKYVKKLYTKHML